MRRVLALVLILLLAATALSAQPVGLSFDPGGKSPTKGFVAVLAYQWLRDNHPSVIAHCDEETDQYDDLDSENISPFKRQAINCLGSIGFFDNYPHEANTNTFDPDGKRPTKGYVAVRAYQWLRDNHPSVIAHCDEETDQYDDLDSEDVSPFKRRAINCQASIGFFDDYPEVSTTTTHTEFGDWEAFTERPDRYGYSLETATEWSLTDTPPRLYFVCPTDTEQGYAYMMLRLKLPPLPPLTGESASGTYQIGDNQPTDFSWYTIYWYTINASAHNSGFNTEIFVAHHDEDTPFPQELWEAEESRLRIDIERLSAGQMPPIEFDLAGTRAVITVLGFPLDAGHQPHDALYRRDHLKSPPTRSS